VINHEKQTRIATRLHKKANVEKDKLHVRHLKSNIRTHSKAVSRLQLDFTDILHQSEGSCTLPPNITKISSVITIQFLTTLR